MLTPCPHLQMADMKATRERELEEKKHEPESPSSQAIVALASPSRATRVAAIDAAALQTALDQQKAAFDVQRGQLEAEVAALNSQLGRVREALTAREDHITDLQLKLADVRDQHFKEKSALQVRGGRGCCVCVGVRRGVEVMVERGLSAQPSKVDQLPVSRVLDCVAVSAVPRAPRLCISAALQTLLCRGRQAVCDLGWILCVWTLGCLSMGGHSGSDIFPGGATSPCRGASRRGGSQGGRHCPRHAVVGARRETRLGPRYVVGGCPEGCRDRVVVTRPPWLRHDRHDGRCGVTGGDWSGNIVSPLRLVPVSVAVCMCLEKCSAYSL